MKSQERLERYGEEKHLEYLKRCCANTLRYHKEHQQEAKWHYEATTKFKPLLNKRCPCCGSTENLEVHHYKTYVSEAVEKGINPNTLDNMINLCHECHREFPMYERLISHNSHEEALKDFINYKNILFKGDL